MPFELYIYLGAFVTYCDPILVLFVFADLFNMRGSDIEYNPVFMAYAAVTNDMV